MDVSTGNTRKYTYFQDWAQEKIKMIRFNWLILNQYPKQFSFPILLEDFFKEEMLFILTNLKEIPLTSAEGWSFKVHLSKKPGRGIITQIQTERGSSLY